MGSCLIKLFVFCEASWNTKISKSVPNKTVRGEMYVSLVFLCNLSVVLYVYGSVLFLYGVLEMC